MRWRDRRLRKSLGFQHLERRERAAHRAASACQVQDAGPGDHRPDTGAQPWAADRRAGAIPDRLARLLRLPPDPPSAHEPGSLDPPKTTNVSLAAVAERAQPLQGTAPRRRTEVQCSGCRRFADGILAHVRTPGGPTGAAQPPLRLARSPPTPCPRRSLTRSNRRGTRPVCPVAWKGRRREAPPYPDPWLHPDLPDVPQVRSGAPPASDIPSASAALRLIASAFPRRADLALQARIALQALPCVFGLISVP